MDGQEKQKGILDLWYCIIKQEPIFNGQFAVYRILKSVKITEQDLDMMHREWAHMLITTPGLMSMVFHRNPDETLFTDAEQT